MKKRSPVTTAVLFLSLTAAACNSSHNNGDPDAAAHGDANLDALDATMSGGDGQSGIDAFDAASATGDSSVPAVSSTAVWTHHNDNDRAGAMLHETQLTSSNVNPSTFGLVFSREVDGQLYAQPLYVPGVEIPARGPRNLVFAATMHNTVYAFDADDPAASAPYWQVSLGPSVPYTLVDNCHDIVPEIGILSTPVIDLATRTIYVVAKTLDPDGQHFRLHALDLATGSEKFGGPRELGVGVTVTGTGSGSDANALPFRAEIQLQRPALTLANGRVFIGFGGWCDRDVFHGWVLAHDAATLGPIAVYAATRNGHAGGIWQSGSGFAVDAAGDVYVTTGDGSFSETSNPPDLGDSVVRLHLSGSTLEATDWFAPHNQAALDVGDFDLGTTGAMLIPATNLVLTGSKQGMFYLLDRDAMGRFDPVDDSRATQAFAATGSLEFNHIHGAPVYWNGPTGGTIYVWPEADVLRTYRFGAGRIDQGSGWACTVHAPDGTSGGFLSLSANGSTAGTGILWATMQREATTNPGFTPGILRAMDASDPSREIWNSEMSGERDRLGTFAKFCPPTIANGRVYVSTFSNQLRVYGLLAH